MRLGIISNLLLLLPSIVVETWAIKPAEQCAGYEDDISELVFRYNPRECMDSVNNQEAPGKFECDDFLYVCSISLESRVECRVRTEDSTSTLFRGIVPNEGSFTLDLRAVHISTTRLECTILGTSPGPSRPCQIFSFDISGDVDLTIGDEYGSIELTECTIGEAGPRPGSPTLPPTRMPSISPTKSPTANPTVPPTKSPTISPTRLPTSNPTLSPTTKSPTRSPTLNPTPSPTKSPTKSPTRSPTPNPTPSPTKSPTKSPTRSPTLNPTPSPTKSPTKPPTLLPTASPSLSPSVQPSIIPTSTPSLSQSPTRKPTDGPTPSPSWSPSQTPSALPTLTPSWNPTSSPSLAPSISQQPSLSMSPTITNKEILFVEGDNNEAGQITKCLTDPMDDTEITEASSFRQYNFQYVVSVKSGSNIDKIIPPIEAATHTELSMEFIKCNFEDDDDSRRLIIRTRVLDPIAQERLGNDEIKGLGIYEISSLPQDRLSATDKCDSQQAGGEDGDDCYVVDAAISAADIGNVDNAKLQSAMDIVLKDAFNGTNTGSTIAKSHENITQLLFIDKSSSVVTGSPASRGKTSGIQDSGGNSGSGDDGISMTPIIVSAVVFGGVVVAALFIRQSRNRRRGGAAADYMKQIDEVSRASAAELDVAISESIAPESIYLEDDGDAGSLVLVGEVSTPEDSFLGASYAFNDEKEKAVAILAPNKGATEASSSTNSTNSSNGDDSETYRYDAGDFRRSWVPDSVNDDSTRCSNECVEIVDASMHSSKEMMKVVNSLAAPKVKPKSRVYVASDTVDL